MIEARVSAYTLDATETIGRVISVERTKADGSAWAVRCDGSCLRVIGGWCYEPMPSSRTDKFLAKHRFASAEAAIAAAQEAIQRWAAEMAKQKEAARGRTST